MKKQIFTLLAGAMIMSSLAFKTMYDIKNATAEAQQIEGLFIFTDSKPVKEYETVGSEKLSVMMGQPTYQNVRDKLVKKIKKEYPTAQGVIFDGNDKAEAIKFK